MEKKEQHGKITAKKKMKENQLFSAAYDLFTTKGINATVIDDIVKKAGVAKGTFYLYFKDKYDILHKLVLNKSNEIVKEALEHTKDQSISFEEKTIFFIDYIINYFKKNTIMLKLIDKNFSWGVYRKAIMKPEQYEKVQEVVKFFIEELMKKGMDLKEAEVTLFMIIELKIGRAHV